MLTKVYGIRICQKYGFLEWITCVGENLGKAVGEIKEAEIAERNASSITPDWRNDERAVKSVGDLYCFGNDLSHVLIGASMLRLVGVHGKKSEVPKRGGRVLLIQI